MDYGCFDDLKGKVAVVTGASKGIGAAIAKKLASDGAKVLLTARSEDVLQSQVEEIEAVGGTAMAVVCDVSDYKSVERVIQSCKSAYGAVDILVNNAGMIDPVARLEESDPEVWGQAADVNYKGVYHGMRAAFPIMKEQGRGVIVNISSGAANAPMEGWSHYCSNKAAVQMLTRCGDKEMSEHGVHVVGLSPGTVATDMMRFIKNSGINPVSQLEWDVHITPEEAAHAVAYLCAEGAAEFAGTDFSIKLPEGRKRAGLPV